MFHGFHQECHTSTSTCPLQTRTCTCLRQAVLDLFAGADQPLTTAQLVEELKPWPMGTRIHTVLLAMQYEGLVNCTEASPWTWTAACGRPGLTH